MYSDHKYSDCFITFYIIVTILDLNTIQNIFIYLNKM